MKISSRTIRNILMPVLLTGALALLLRAGYVGGQQQPLPVAQPSPSPPPVVQTSPSPQASPQPSPTPDEILEDLEVLRVESNLVVVPVSVIDAAGQPVQGLTATDFHLLEEGRRQEIAQAGSPEQVPLEIALLLDVSSSVSQRFEFEQQAATRFLKEVLKSADKAAVFAIDRESRLEQALGSADIASAKLLSLKAATEATPTAFYDTVVAAAHYLAKNTPERHRRVIVVISDGEDNFSNSIRQTEIAVRQIDASDPSKEAVQKRREQLEKQRNDLHRKAQTEVLREVQRSDVVFYSINPSGDSLKLNKISMRAQEGMQKLADETGGTAFAPNKVEDLEAVFRQITSELRAQYLLQYYSTDESPTGTYLRLKVNVPAKPLLRVRARQGYYAKRKP